MPLFFFFFIFGHLGSSLLSFLWICFRKMSTSTSLSCSSGVLSCSFLWDIFLCHLCLCFCGFHSAGCRVVALLASVDLSPCGWGWSQGLVLASWGEDWFVSTAGWSWVLFLLWAGPCQGLCLVISCGFSKTLGSLSADWWAMFPPCWLFGLRCSSTGAYRRLGGARPWWENGGLQESSCQ